VEELKDPEVRVLDPMVPLEGLVLLGLGPLAIWFFIVPSGVPCARKRTKERMR
jgi:hypothetical protein